MLTGEAPEGLVRHAALLTSNEREYAQVLFHGQGDGVRATEFSGHNTQLPLSRFLGPGFRGLNARSRARSSFSKDEAEPSGLPVLSWRRNASASPVPNFSSEAHSRASRNNLAE